MGFRTVVILNNDLANQWTHDHDLGNKIMSAVHRHDFEYGQILEQVHADQQSLAILDSYCGKVVAATHWCTGKDDAKRDLELLKALAEKLGYRVVRKSVK